MDKGPLGTSHIDCIDKHATTGRISSSPVPNLKPVMTIEPCELFPAIQDLFPHPAICSRIVFSLPEPINPQGVSIKREISRHRVEARAARLRDIGRGRQSCRQPLHRQKARRLGSVACDCCLASRCSQQRGGRRGLCRWRGEFHALNAVAAASDDRTWQSGAREVSAFARSASREVGDLCRLAAAARPRKASVCNNRWHEVSEIAKEQ